MNAFDCESIRDQLPALMRGEMLPHEAASAELHLEGCAECRRDAEIIALLQETSAVAPAGLERRIVDAVNRRVQRRVPVGRMAMAATLAAAVLGGSMMFGRLTERETAPADLSSLSWAAAEDPLLHGRSELQELSVDELEDLLAELEP